MSTGEPSQDARPPGEAAQSDARWEPGRGNRDFAATWFDGASAQLREAAVAVAGGSVHVRATDRISDYRLDSLRLSAPVAGVPLRIALPDGGTLIVRDQDEQVATLLGRPARSLAHRLEQNLPFVFLAWVLLAVIGYFAYRDGIPWLAAKVATRIPYSAEAALGETILSGLDRIAFEESRLPDTTRQDIDAAFARLITAADGAQGVHLKFRRSRGFIGANAFAIPGGTVLVTDQLVERLGGVDKIAAVLAHEIGHQVRRHALVQLLESSAIALIFGAVAGDVSGVGSIAATAPGVILRLNYSRDAEDEADRFAYDALSKTGSSPALLGDALETLVRSRCDRPPDPDDEDDDPPRRCEEKAPRFGGRPDYFSTHPAIESRIANARAAANR